MRKITRLASEAFIANENWHLDNTRVAVEENRTVLYLHNNIIALKNHNDSDGVLLTLAGWGTPTTRERLNGLLAMLGHPGVGFSQRRFEQYLRTTSAGRPVGDDELISINLLTGDEYSKG